ncbi:hypothetical protein SEA_SCOOBYDOOBYDOO_175 [Mycobacterium phage ScoobyDoobyDoo]|nr:hypothetical protein SEA_SCOOBYDOOBYDOO_175 [Mycobacterium phage ScoobyDoobyDoo]
MSKSRDDRRRELQFLTNEQVCRIRRRMDAAYARCDRSYFPLTREIWRITEKYGITVGVLATVMDDDTLVIGYGH